ncbi:Crp/Fnr family transcriptional regulator [Sinorhizobium sp. BG8]|nr:Crp/Fnr family transcriptional regulator [Sinorhizobium sp. BG8]
MFPIFESLTDEEDLKWIAKCSVRKLRTGDTLAERETPACEVFGVLSGEIRALYKVAVGKEVILGGFRRGDIVGEISALDGEPRCASLSAVNDSSVLVVPGEVFQEILSEKPGVSLFLLRLLSQRVRILNSRVSELSFLDTKHRLYNTLLRLSRHRGLEGAERVISPPVVHAELAEHIGSSRETVSREMARLVRSALIERTNAAIILKDPAELSSRISRALDS